MKKSHDWDKIQGFLADRLVPTFLGKDSEATEMFIRHVSEHLVEALRRNKPEMAVIIRKQLSALKAIHGIQIERERWEEILDKLELVISIGVLFI